MLFDSHTHTYFPPLHEDQNRVIENMKAAWVGCAVQIGCDLESSLVAIELAKQYPTLFVATAGIHPGEGVKEETNVEKESQELLNLVAQHRENIVAIGEVGLDYYRLEGNTQILKEKQQELFVNMIQIANKYELPVVIHSREAFDDVFAILQKNPPKQNFVLHCYSENWEKASLLLSAFPDCYFGLAGMLTYKKSDELREVAQKLPINHILLETDAPFLAPQIVRWQTNEPAFMRHTFDFFATQRTESKASLEAILWENSHKFYRMT